MINLTNLQRRVMKRPAAILFLCNLVFNIFLATCEGVVYKIPLKKTGGHSLRNGAQDRVRRGISASSNLHGRAGEGYYLAVNIGTPPQKFNVLLDTGSSNFAIAATPDPSITDYFDRDKSSTYKNIGTEVSVPYTQGNWKGILGTDLVTLPILPNVTVRPNIAFITSSQSFFINGSNWQGIVGFAYQSISRPDHSLEPFFDTLVRQGHVNNIFSIQLCGSLIQPNTAAPDMDGSLVIGGISSDLYKGKIFYTPITKEWYYEVVLTDIAVNNVSLGMDCKEYNFDKTIVDSGTTNLRLPVKVYHETIKRIKQNLKMQYLERMPSDAFWAGTEIVCWQTDPTLPLLSFPYVSLSLARSDGLSFTLHVGPQHYLRSIDETTFGMQGYCFKFGIASSGSGTVLGAIIMEGYYIIFDRINKQVGFAQTSCPARFPGITTLSSNIQGPVKIPGNITHCMYQKPEKNNSTLLIVAYVMAGICGLCVLPLIVMIIQWQVRRCRKHQDRARSSDVDSLVSDR